MKISGINHINIVVTEAQLPVEIAFYEQILGLVQGQRAPSRRNGAWLYCNDKAIIHLSVVETAPQMGGNTHFNHVALGCSGLDGFLAKLAELNLPYEIDYRSPPEMTQIFLMDPVGVKVELNFPFEKPATEQAYRYDTRTNP